MRGRCFISPNGKDGAWGIAGSVGRFRQGDLADLLGATTRSIITILNAWRSSGVVAYDAQKARLTICKEAVLQGLLDDAAR